MYAFQDVELSGALSEKSKASAWKGVWKVSLVLAATSAVGSALFGALAAPKNRGRVAIVSGLGAGLSTLGTALLIGRYALERADQELKALATDVASQKISELIESYAEPEATA